MIRRWFLISLLFCLPLTAFAADKLQFARQDKVLKEATVEELFQDFIVKDVLVWEPHEEKEVSYQGVESQILFDRIFGQEWRKEDEILFTCTDGYQPSIPVADFLKNRSWFVFGKTDKSPFEVVNNLQNKERVPLGPLYLVWDNLKNEELRQQGGNGWPYQIVKMQPIQFSARYPRLAPPEKEGSRVRSGFLAFRKYCFDCHKVNGEGGDKGPELNYPVSVVEYWKPKWLEQWLLDPTSIRSATPMPALPTALKRRAETARDILSYLQVMSRHKQPPPPAKP